MIFQKIANGVTFVFIVLLGVIITLFGGLFGVAPLMIDIIRIKFFDHDVIGKKSDQDTPEESTYPRNPDTYVIEHFPEREV